MRERQATPDEAVRIALVLGFAVGAKETLKRNPPPVPALPIRRLYLPPSDRPFAVRLSAARNLYPKVLADLERSIQSREDCERLLAFLEDSAVDSSLEALVLLRLLADGANVGFDSPGRYGYSGDTIIEPIRHQPIVGWHRPMLTLKNLAFFPQVCFRVSRVIRVDHLVCMLLPDQTVTWCVLEIDGLGHQTDSTRNELSHPIVRVSTSEVLADEFVKLTKNKLTEACSRAS